MASAVPITVPTDLNPGDQYRLAFVTSTITNPFSSDIETYNSYVTGRANTVPELVALGTTWKVIGSTAATDARDNTHTNPFLDGVGVPIYMLDDSRLADNNADLWDAALDQHFRVTESGAIIGTINAVYTGTSTTGEGSTVLGSSTPRIGRADVFNSSGWISYTNANPANKLPLYALSNVITVVPEPSTGLLLATGLLGLGIHRRRAPRSDGRVS